MTLGKFAEPATIRVKEDAEPHVDRPRKCNINLKPKIEAELKQMEDTGVIRKVREHTACCSSIVYSTKCDGRLWICLDPKMLNKSIMRCPHKMLTVEEINPAFVGAKHFSKLDAKAVAEEAGGDVSAVAYERESRRRVHDRLEE